MLRLLRLVVDANVLVSAFLKDSLTRRILLDERLNLITPEHGFIETRRVLQRPKMLKRIGLEPAVFEELWAFLTSRIQTFPETDYQKSLGESIHLAVHPEDAPYIALAIKFQCPIWTNDPDFQIHAVKKSLQIYKTHELREKLQL